MTTKKSKGFTLVELIVTISIMVVVIGAAGAVMTSGFETYRADRRLQTAQVHIRNAMLAIQRDVHMAQVVSVDGIAPYYNILRLYYDYENGGYFTYTLQPDPNNTAIGELYRSSVPADWPVHFSGASLALNLTEPDQGFVVEIIDGPDNEPQWLEITLRTPETAYGAATMEIEQARISLRRIP